MPYVVDAASVERAVRVLLAAIDVDGGPTDEQRAVLAAVVEHLWERPDLDLDALTPIAVADAPAALPDPAERRRVAELMVTLELCRHPQTPAQVARVEELSAVLGVGGPHLEITRSWIEAGAERATEDFDRFYAAALPQLSEPSLRERYLTLDAPDTDLAARLAALGDLPDGTLGRAYLAFYERNGITLPGADAHFPAHYVSHDMNHVIAGYEPTGPGEVALGAFTLAMNDNDANWLQFVTNLVIHEAGLLKHGEIQPKASTLARSGATRLLGEAFARGAQCTADFSQADHLALADWMLADVRAHFNVVPLAHPMV